MIETLNRLVAQYRHNGILIDTNILLLLFVGRFDPKRITRFKNTEKFTEDDFALLEILLENFTRLITTPYILAEVNSFANQFGEPIRSLYFKKFAEQISLLDEVYTPGSTLASIPEFVRYGLTDLSIFAAAREKVIVLTDDGRFADFLSHNQLDVLNFDHLRRFM
jgi:rRNA-processing protein FCF1